MTWRTGILSLLLFVAMNFATASGKTTGPRKVFQKAFTRLGLSDRLQESTLLEAWPHLIGPSLATHCRPGLVRRGKLMVYVDHPAWLHQITMAHKGNILSAVQKHFPHLKIQELVLKIGR